MIRKGTRYLALGRPCPKCGVGPHVRCIGSKGTSRRAVHIQRTQGSGDARDATAPSDEFYRSERWRKLRYKALLQNGGRCQCCGATAEPGRSLHVDHIKPRSKFPQGAFDLKNLQVLCEACNLGKGASDQTDWRRGAS